MSYQSSFFFVYPTPFFKKEFKFNDEFARLAAPDDKKKVNHLL